MNLIIHETRYAKLPPVQSAGKCSVRCSEFVRQETGKHLALPRTSSGQVALRYSVGYAAPGLIEHTRRERSYTVTPKIS